MDPTTKKIFIWAIIAVALFFLLRNISNHSDQSSGSVTASNVEHSRLLEQMDTSQFFANMDAGKIEQVFVYEGSNTIKGVTKDGDAYFETTIPPQLMEHVLLQLKEKHIMIMTKPIAGAGNVLLSIFVSWFPMLLFIAIWIFFMRKMNGGGVGGSGGLMGIGKSKAKMIEPENVTTTFADVAGVDEAKADLEEVIQYLENPDKFTKIGAKFPRGVLLIGPPGTGKTLLAKAVAGSAKRPFFFLSGADFTEIFVGVGAARVRDMFEQARKVAPCIIFIDELDAVGRARGNGKFGGNDEREQTLNQLLVEMDGMGTTAGIIVIAATNRLDVLDNALLRPGRFDRHVMVSLPDLVGREAILNVHIKEVKTDNTVDTKTLAGGTTGFSGADLANLINEAALLAAREGLDIVSKNHFEKARDKIMMGAERKTFIMDEKEKEKTAYHEAGHTLIGMLEKDKMRPLHKVSIIPRGRALGVTMFVDDKDEVSKSWAQIKAEVKMAYGGRLAEEIIYGSENVTTGASNDIERITSILSNSVRLWGFKSEGCDDLGILYYGPAKDNDGSPFGVSHAPMHNSDETNHIIDSNVRRIAEDLYNEARQMILDNYDYLRLITKALIKFETIDRAQLDQIMSGVDITK